MNKAIEINHEWCKGCGICVAFCSKEALTMNAQDKAVLKEENECNACGLCELRCPDMAIEVKGRKKEGGEDQD